ncbi:hypothetical protein [Allochromatium vinosum]|uniref:hypothetical protein n=1 Tax=Allochromatium vinosum TaxID=1049 RepID=UPI0019050B57|nr:hypothetical protein [Allochromatium vinosum]MBK1653216.1 hypothetical protein [Allochromatium vinosum]
MKLIKFDLPVDGVQVKSIEELREHFTAEILGHYRSGLLFKWLSSRKLYDELSEVKLLGEMESDFDLLKRLSEILRVYADDDSLQLLIEKINLKFDHEVNNFSDSDSPSELECELTSPWMVASNSNFCCESMRDFLDIPEGDLKEFFVEAKIDELREKAKGKKLPLSLQEMLFNCDLEIAKIILAENISVNCCFVMDLAKKGTPKTREFLAENPSVNIEVQQYLIETGSDEIKKALARNVSVSIEIQSILAEDPNWRIRYCIAKNPSISFGVQQKLSQDSDVDVISALAENSSLLDEYENLWVSSKEEKIRIGLAKNLKLSVSNMEVLSKDSSRKVKKALAGNASLPDRLQAKLMHDGGDEIKIELARNESIAIALQAELSTSWEIDILIALFDNKNLADFVKKSMFPRFNNKDLAELKEKSDELNDKHTRALLQSLEHSKKLINANFSNSIFMTDAKRERIQMDQDELDRKCDGLSREYDAIYEKYKKYKSIMELKEKVENL